MESIIKNFYQLLGTVNLIHTTISQGRYFVITLTEESELSERLRNIPKPIQPASGKVGIGTRCDSKVCIISRAQFASFGAVSEIQILCSLKCKYVYKRNILNDSKKIVSQILKCPQENLFYITMKLILF